MIERILKKKKCKHCKAFFQPKAPLQYLCFPPASCSWEYAKKKNQEKLAKEERKETRVMKISTHAKEYRGLLQDQINLLARKIDSFFNLKCIDCEGEYGKKIDGAHYHSRGGNCTLRYNLHNIHSARSYCNQFSDKHKEGYKEGLKNRYGLEYQEMVLSLPLKYKQINLSSQDIYDKLKIVRAINRTFDTYKLENPIQAREMFNKIIGIYG